MSVVINSVSSTLEKVGKEERETKTREEALEKRVEMRKTLNRKASHGGKRMNRKKHCKETSLDLPWFTAQVASALVMLRHISQSIKWKRISTNNPNTIFQLIFQELHIHHILSILSPSPPSPRSPLSIPFPAPFVSSLLKAFLSSINAVDRLLIERHPPEWGTPTRGPTLNGD